MRGAFTSADANKEGLLEVAEKGTIFLDEIGEMGAVMQVKLLRLQGAASDGWAASRSSRPTSASSRRPTRTWRKLSRTGVSARISSIAST